MEEVGWSFVIIDLQIRVGGIDSMPSYDFVCKQCKKKFTLMLSLAEYEKARPSCPKCKSKKVEQCIASFFAVTSKKS
jgi:putative FmdB family regulatory protein